MKIERTLTLQVDVIDGYSGVVTLIGKNGEPLESTIASWDGNLTAHLGATVKALIQRSEFIGSLK